MSQGPMQDQISGRAADARVAGLSGRLVWTIALAGAALTLIFAVTILATAFHLTSEEGTRALATDFRVFWAAGRLALEGEFLAPFDRHRLSAEHNVAPESWMLWLYPPGYLLLLLPFGAMSFAWALSLSNLLSVALLALALRSFVAGSPLVWLALVLAPASMPALMLGQNSLLWMACLLAALAALRDGRALLAGIFIGCLTLKPQLGLLIPIALLAAGLWRTFLAAGVTAVALAVLPTLVTGFGYWPLLRLSLAAHGERLLPTVGDIVLMVSPAFFLTFFGVGNDLAWTVQWIITAASALAVFALWRSDRVGFDVKAAGLLCAILLSAPYLWYYEGVLMVAIALFLLRGGVLILRPLHLLLLVPLWVGGGLQALNTFADLVDQRWLGAAYISPLLLICIGLCLRPLLQTRGVADAV